MAFAPSGALHLCNVPFDNSYKNQIYFDSAIKQQAYFVNKAIYTVVEYLHIRKTKPNGGMRSSVKVGYNIDDLYKCNYMAYQNNSGGLWVYAFITELIYVNEHTTEIVFETDVYQTWLFDVTIKDSFVVREHSETDKLGESLTPEPFSFDNYDFYKLASPVDFIWGYLIVASEPIFGAVSRGTNMSGVYQGLYFYYAVQPSHVNTVLDKLEELGSDCIVSITAIPTFNVADNNVIVGDDGTTYGQLGVSTEPHSKEYEVDLNSYALTFDGYDPKNNKLFSAPFMKLLISNHCGEQREYEIDSFGNRNIIKFNIVADVSPTPSIYMYPKNYKRHVDAFDFGIALGDFPQCSFNNDVYKLWLNQNMKAAGYSAITAGLQGAVNGMLYGGAVGAVAGGAVNFAGSIANTMAEGMRMEKAANTAHAGDAKTNLLTAAGFNKFDIYMRMIKREFAEQIDDYFTMFGYAVNRVKKPNLSSRPYFNYVQTQGINLIGSIPNDDMERLKKVYDDGVTLWKPTATVGDYSVDNSP